jgi:hypothetical protein
MESANLFASFALNQICWLSLKFKKTFLSRKKTLPSHDTGSDRREEISERILCHGNNESLSDFCTNQALPYLDSLVFRIILFRHHFGP